MPGSFAGAASSDRAPERPPLHLGRGDAARRVTLNPLLLLQESMSLKYEPASVPQHNSVKRLFLRASHHSQSTQAAQAPPPSPAPRGPRQGSWTLLVLRAAVPREPAGLPLPALHRHAAVHSSLLCAVLLAPAPLSPLHLGPQRPQFQRLQFPGKLLYMRVSLLHVLLTFLTGLLTPIFEHEEILK